MWQACKSQAERIRKIKELLDTNDRAVYRGIVAIYKLQTEEEKSCETTRVSNGVGFSAFDAEFMTSLAKDILSGRGLSPKQLAIGRNKIKRYARQLADIAKTRESTT